MRFPYHQRLSSRDQSTYRASDRILTVSLPVPALLHPLVGGLKDALAREDHRLVEPHQLMPERLAPSAESPSSR